MLGFGLALKFCFNVSQERLEFSMHPCYRIQKTYTLLLFQCLKSDAKKCWVCDILFVPNCYIILSFQISTLLWAAVKRALLILTKMSETLIYLYNIISNFLKIWCWLLDNILCWAYWCKRCDSMASGSKLISAKLCAVFKRLTLR